MKYLYNEYIDDVLKEKIITCKAVKDAVGRHADDLKKSKTKNFEYYFDEEKAKHIIDFVSLLTHSKGELAGKAIELEPWQQFIVANIFGWRNKKTKLRRFKTAYVQVARKNGKSTMLAGIANYVFLADKEQGAEVYFIATKKSQAAIAYREARHQIKKCKALNKRVNIYEADVIRIKEDDTAKMLPLTRESKSEDGHNPSFLCVDEYHAHEDNELKNVMENGMLARKQPLTFIITTAGFNKDSVCYKEYEYVKSILSGVVTDDKYFAIIFEPDTADEWTDDIAIKKANPNLNISVNETDIKDRIQKALIQTHQQTEVKTKLLNIWTQAASIWIAHERWKELYKKRELTKGMKCAGALDLSTTTDLTCYTLCFLPTDDFPYFSWTTKYFMPRDTIIERTKKDRVPYDTWAAQGYITLTDGDVTDYKIVENSILKDREEFDIIEMAYDPWNSSGIVSSLETKGLKMIPIPQRFAVNGLSMSIKITDQHIIEKKVCHDNNPVLNFNFACVELRTDGNDNYLPKKPDRKKDTKRIDGAVTAAMSLDRAVRVYTAGVKKSVYEERGVTVL